MITLPYSIEVIEKFFEWACTHSAHVCRLQGMDIPYPHGTFPNVIAIGAKKIIEIPYSKEAFLQLEHFLAQCNAPVYGYLGYDLKNELEHLYSKNSDTIGFADMLFFEPIYTLQWNYDTIECHGFASIEEINRITSVTHTHKKNAPKVVSPVAPSIGKAEYIKKTEALQQHIQNGDIYEVNFCTYFQGVYNNICPVKTYKNLINIAPAPFSSFIKCANKYLMCASPERFLKNDNGTLVSQPIKGTRKRSPNPDIDRALKQELSQSPKEQSENVMIVDLVRNDLSKVAKDGSVKVEELFGIYSFSHVHQMISTVTAQLGKPFSPLQALQSAFPMGSMTGAPKLRAMQLIEKYENFKRGIFSGAVGYMMPNDNFDFNVVIRSILYNADSGHLIIPVGSAITYDAHPESEWEECATKAQAPIEALLSVCF